MKWIKYAVLIVGVTSAAPSYGADAKIQAAIATFKAAGADSAKLGTYCAMSKEMTAGGEKADAASDAKVDGYMKTLGQEFEAAWNAGEGLDETSADGKALAAALDELDSKCPQ